MALFAVAAVVGLGLAFAAGWFAYQEYVRWRRLSTLLEEGPFGADSSSSSDSETASKGDIEDPNKEYLRV
jgi:hypothetical protein